MSARKQAVAAVVALGAIGAANQANAYCVGTPRDPLVPQNPHCDVSQFLNPTFTKPTWWGASGQTNRDAMIYQCTHYQPNVKPPPAEWCRAAMTAQLGRSR